LNLKRPLGAHTLFESGLVPDKFVTQNIPKAGEEDGSDPSIPAVVCVLCLQAGPCVDLPVKHSRVFALTSGLPLREELVLQLHVGYLGDNPGVEEGRELESQGVTPVPFSKRTCILCILPSRVLSPIRLQSIGVDSPATLSRDAGGSTGGRFTSIRKQKG
jgi:hypothetical protein